MLNITCYFASSSEFCSRWISSSLVFRLYGRCFCLRPTTNFVPSKHLSQWTFFFLQHSFASTKYALTGSLLIWCSFGPSLTAWYHKQHYTITSSNAVQFSEKNNGNPAPLAITTTKCHNKIRTIFTVVYMCMRMMCLFGYVSACVLFCMTVVACCVNQIEYSEASIIATFNQMDQTNAITWNGMKIRSICSANLINIYVLANFYFSPWLWVAGEALYFVCCLCSSAVTNNGGGE